MGKIKEMLEERRRRHRVIAVLDEEMVSIVTKMQSTDKLSDEYVVMLKRLKEIQDLKGQIKTTKLKTLDSWMPAIKIMAGVLTCAGMEKVFSIVFTGKSFSLIR